jgi:hypothetical protein
MLRKLFSFAGILSLAISTFAAANGAGPATAASLSAQSCRAAFEVSLEEGPSAPLTVAGFLNIQIEPDGSFTGTLSREDASLVVSGKADFGKSLNVVGQANGRSISMVVDLGNGQHIFGVGASQNDLAACNGDFDGVMGGPAVGPQPGDHGDWFGGTVICFFGRFCCDLTSGSCGEVLPRS